MKKVNTIHVTTASDRNMAPCLHAMLLSTMEHLADEYKCVFHLYLKEFKPSDIKLIHQTLAAHSHRVELRVNDVELINLGAGNGISRNKMCYSIFAAFDEASTDHIIWIDADMIVLTDLSNVWMQMIDSENIAHVVARKELKFAHHMERKLMKDYGMSDQDPFFNSAFVGVNSKKFRMMDGFNRSLEFIGKHPEQSDQGVVNYLFYKDLFLLDHKYNSPYWPHDQKVDLNPRDIVCHFIGSPKPWDLFGDILHPSYAVFELWIQKTAYKSTYKKRYFSIAAWKRLFHICYKYWPLLKRSLKRK